MSKSNIVHIIYVSSLAICQACKLLTLFSHGIPLTHNTILYFSRFFIMSSNCISRLNAVILLLPYGMTVFVSCFLKAFEYGFLFRQHQRQFIHFLLFNNFISAKKLTPLSKLVNKIIRGYQLSSNGSSHRKKAVLLLFSPIFCIHFILFLL